MLRTCATLACLPLLLSACQGARETHAPASPAPSIAPVDKPSADTISGTVIDTAGQPVRGARVALVPIGLFDLSGAKFAHADSAVDGRFRFAGVGSGRYGVTATAPDGTAWATDLGASSTDVRLQLGGGRRLSGSVRDRGGRPRAGAEVRLARGLGDRGDVFLVETAADGRWTAVVPDGDYAISAVQGADAAAPTAGRDLVLDPVWPPGEPPPAVVDWLRGHEIPLTSVVVGHGFADLAPVRAIVGDARVVGLGEATHGTREIFQLKHRLLEFLVSELGFTVFAIEISLPESLAIDDYVLGGRGDPEQLLAGQFVAVWQTEELRDVIRWMREWNRTHARKVRFHGLDMRVGIRAAKDALAYLARVDRDVFSSPAARALAPMADPVLYQEIVRRPKPDLTTLAAHARELVAQLESRRAQYVARSSAEAWWRAVMEARVVAQLLESIAAADTAGRVRVRERSMADNLFHVLEHYGPDARAVVWAHNAHIAGNLEAEPRMMGVHLRARLGAGYRAFGSTLDRGAYQSVDGSRLLRDFTVEPAAPGSLENTLATAGRPIAIVDLRTATGVAADWFHAFQAMRQFDGLYDDERPTGWASTRTIVAREYDALVFVAVGAVARRLPYPRAVNAVKPPPAAPLANLDLEEADGTRPRGWLWSPRARVCGYAVAIDRQRPFAGRASARIERTRDPRYGECAGELRQLVDAASYRGKQVRLRAAVRVERAGEHAHLYFQSGEHRAAKVASGGGWRAYEVVLDVPGDAATFEIGIAFDGDGRAWLDAVEVTALP